MPEFLVTDGGAGLERTLAPLWPDVPAQRCTVHKHRNLLAHALAALHDEVTADYTDMIYAATAKEVQARRRAFLRKWRLRSLSRRRRELGGSRRSAVCLPPPTPKPVEVGADRQRH